MRKVWILVLALSVAACGKDDNGNGGSTQAHQAPPTQDAGADIAALVPADTLVYIHLGSLDWARGVQTKLAEVTGEAIPNDPVDNLSMVGQFDASHVDPSRPLGVAISLMGGMQPQLTFVVPAKDAEALKASFKGPASAAEGGYVALSQVHAYAGGGGSRLVSGMPTADALVRVDFAKLMELVGPMAEGGLAMVEVRANQEAANAGVDASNMIRDAAAWARDLMRSVDIIDLTAALSGSMLDANLGLSIKEGSPLATPGEAARLSELAGHIAGDYPMVLLLNIDMKWWMDFSKTMAGMAAEQMPPEAREAFEKSMLDWDKWMQYVGNDFAFGAAFDGGGIRMGGAMSSPDAAGYIQAVKDMNKDNPMAGLGFTVSEATERDVNGVKVHRMRMQADPEKLGAAYGMPPEQAAMMTGAIFGAGGATFDLAADGGKLLFTMGKDGGDMEACLKGGAAPAPVKSLLSGAPGNVFFLMHFDLREVMRGAVQFAQGMGAPGAPELPAGGPVPFSVVAARAPLAYHIGVKTDVSGLKEIGKIMAEGSPGREPAAPIEPVEVDDGR